MVGKGFIGVDIGGTSVKFAIVNQDGKIVIQWEEKTDISHRGIYIVPKIVASIEEKLMQASIDKEQILGIGVGAPGFIDVEKGAIYEAVNIGWDYFPLKDELEKALQLPVFVDNDANLAAAGEMWQGAAVGAKNMLCVTLGTGVGGGIITHGKIVHGFKGMAGEIGHTTVAIDGGVPCNCGKIGCLETIASATGITRMAIEALANSSSGMLKEMATKNGQITAKAVFAAAKKNDKLALRIVHEALKHLGLVIGNLANALNPQVIIIGGGVSQAGSFLLEILQHYVKQYTIPKVYRDTEIRLAALGNAAGVVGAAWLVKENLSN